MEEKKQKPKQKQLGKSPAALKRRARIIAKAMLEGKTQGDALRAAGYTRPAQTTPVLSYRIL